MPLPLEPFRYYQYGQRTVHLDGCVEVEAAYYGPPPGWIGRLGNVQWNDFYVRLLDPRTGQLLREHVRQKRGGYASTARITRSGPRSAPCSCWRERDAPEPTSVPFAKPFIASKENWVCAA